MVEHEWEKKGAVPTLPYQVRDLLVAHKQDDQHRSLRVRQHPVSGPFVDGLSSYIVPDFESVMALLKKGDSARTIASTNMNERSSRSHAIFTMTLSQLLLVSGAEDTRCRTSKIHLVDLAGSERVLSSGVEGRHFREVWRLRVSNLLDTILRWPPYFPPFQSIDALEPG